MSEWLECYGLPIWCAAFGITWISLNLYFQECAFLKKLIKHLDNGKSIRDFKEGWFTLTGGYLFKNLSKINPEYLKYKKVQESVESIYSLRRFYKYTFPTLIILLLIGFVIYIYGV